jgi:glycosyltransferase involved in cell wall biosynthesis
VSGPEISVIVPVYRDWDELAGFLDAYAGQQGRDRAELIVVDNDPEGCAAAPPGARLMRCARPGSYAARNVGAAAARGARLLFTDADCRPRPGWLGAHLALGAQATIGAGPVHMTAGPDPGRWEVFDLVRGIPQAAYVAHGYGATANLSVPAATFRRLAGFDAGRLSGGDAEFCRRAGRAGVPTRLVAEAVTRHPARASRAALLRKLRRVKGGQIAAGPLPRRLVWTLRTCTPPVREAVRYLSAPHPPRHRLTAVGVRFQLWGAELAEMARLWAGGAPERR